MALPCHTRRVPRATCHVPSSVSRHVCTRLAGGRLQRTGIVLSLNADECRARVHATCCTVCDRRTMTGILASSRPPALARAPLEVRRYYCVLTGHLEVSRVPCPVSSVSLVPCLHNQRLPRAGVFAVVDAADRSPVNTGVVAGPCVFLPAPCSL